MPGGTYRSTSWGITIADIIGVHEVYDVGDGLWVVRGISIYFHIEDMDLVGTTDRWNSAKLAELSDRVVHG